MRLSTRPLRSLALVLGLVLLGAPSLAEAQQQRPMTFQQRLEAKRLFNQAHLEYKRGEYEAAIIKWEKSYDLSGEALIFESVASAYERLGDLGRSKEFLTKWRAEAPAKEHKELDERLASLELRIAEQKEKERREEEARLEAQRNRPGDSGPSDADQRRAKEQAEAERAADAFTRDVVSWSLVGAGAAAVVTGLVLDGVADAGRPDQAEACRNAAGLLLCSSAQQRAIQTSNGLAIGGDVSWMVGGAMTVTGVVLLFTWAGIVDESTPGATSAATAIAPVVGPSQAGLGLSGRF